MVSMQELIDSLNGEICLNKNGTSRGFTYLQHVRLALELNIARLKIYSICHAVENCYQEAVWRHFLYVGDKLSRLINRLDENLFLEQKKNRLSIKAKTIYFKGLGYKVAKLQRLNFTITPPAISTHGKKPGFTSSQYQEVNRRFEELQEFFYFLEIALLVPYAHDLKIGKELRAILVSLKKAQEKLEKRLKKKHGEGNILFETPKAERTVLDQTTTDLSSCSIYFIANYLKALAQNDQKKIWYLDELAANCTSSIQNEEVTA